ncbi:MAG: hypothetical protein OEV42_01585 [Deltaproteobacteria bacterium]|nr:hypothetical protein [Deltaproteobacteria bacterium]
MTFQQEAQKQAGKKEGEQPTQEVLKAEQVLPAGGLELSHINLEKKQAPAK